MNFETAIELMYENQTHLMIDEMYKEDSELEEQSCEPDFGMNPIEIKFKRINPLDLIEQIKYMAIFNLTKLQA